ncbi:MAG: indolepyruvate oxidoreductase subunit beta family protein [Rhizobiaceae bacterium]
MSKAPDMPKATTSSDGIIKLAIMAVGGQGGGVLTNWIEDCARRNGYAVQATSVAGVAQRTGATIYYIEMAPAGDREPIFSLMPAAGDVDILLAAEMMEAGRAILRGFVTPDRTTLIASTHRALAVSEKTIPGDGISSTQEVFAAAGIAARRFVHFDLEKVAIEAGSVISASLLGALAGAQCLPFTRQQFEESIRISGRGVDTSLHAFGHAFDLAAGIQNPEPEPTPADLPVADNVPEHLRAGWQQLETRLEQLPEPVRAMARRGLRAVVDYQDLAYGEEYLDHVFKVLECDNAEDQFRLTHEAAKYLARAMAYDDTFRVADLKTRGRRFDRIAREMAQPDGARMKLTEFMHPRAEEIVGMMPHRLGLFLSRRPRTMRFIDRLFNRGRRLRTDRLPTFVMLYLLGGARRWRRGTLRHAQEVTHLQSWLDEALAVAQRDYGLAVELIGNRRLIKGYSDTHARGLSKFDRVNQAARQLSGRDDAAQWMARLREAALKDEKGVALDGALKTVASFAEAKD